MAESIARWIPELVSFIVGLASGFSLKVLVDKRRISIEADTTSTQSGNVVGGHMAGRDVNIRDPRA